MRAVIADDERLSRRALRAQLDRRGDIVVAAECADGRSALAAIEREEPDVVFLDIQMPHMDGFQLLDRLQAGVRPAIIFVTAYDEHALRAFEVEAVDFLLKPYDESRLNAAVERAVARRRDRSLLARVESVLSSLQEGRAILDSGYARRLLVRCNGRASFVQTAGIDWVEAVRNDVRIHVSGDTHLIRMTISELERRLHPAHFMRIHRSIIANLDHIAHIEPYGGSDYRAVLRDGTRLRVSRTARDRLLRNAQ